MKFFNFKEKSGVAALPAVLVIGGFITEIVIVAMVSSFLLVNSEYNIRLSSSALFAAKSGVNNAILHVARDMSYSVASSTLSVGSAVANVDVYRDSPSVGKHKIISTGTIQNRSRRLEAILVIDTFSGAVRLESLNEVSL